MKIYLIVFLVLILAAGAGAQNLTSSNPATLQVYLQKENGDQVVLTYNELNNQYNNLTMTGELDIHLLMTGDEQVRILLDSIGDGTITYTTVIPEGQFEFQNTLNYSFTSEVEMMYGEKVSRFVMNWEISNRKTDLANTFAIVCTATLSLSEDLGIQGSCIVKDRISFQFFQNVRAMTY